MENWSEAALQGFVRRQLKGRRFLVVSNREPYTHDLRGGRIECVQPASGLLTALEPILHATGGTWIAHGSGTADRAVVDVFDRVKVPPGDPQYTLRRVWLDPQLEREYYCGLANEGLWPLCHMAFHRPVFRLQDWIAYREANRIFADAVLEEAAGEAAFVFIQDYHFGLLPRMLKERNPKLVVAQFWHIPWPHPEAFRVFPWGEELLDGMLGNDLLGFHLNSHCSNFLDAVDLGIQATVDGTHSSVRRRAAETLVRSFPISIDYASHVSRATSPEVDSHMEAWRGRLGGQPAFLGIGIDRSDYTKGIPERLHAIDRLFELHPEYRGQFVFVQVAVPSRTLIDGYRDLNDEAGQAAAHINERWGTDKWMPIHFCNRHLPQAELMALHRLAQVCVVSSLHDGMNLVAKEFVASRVDGDGTLVLSSFAGAARELTAALMVNPFSPDEMAGAIHRALQMPVAERRARMARMAAVVREHNIYAWAGKVLTALVGLDAQRQFTAPRDPLRLRAVAASRLQMGAVN
jgi:trehalose-6-phosphate synthase